MRVSCCAAALAVADPPRKLLTARTTGDCTGASLSKLSAGDSCTAPWSKLRTAMLPTQPSVGFAWVERQRQQHFSSAKKSGKWFGSHSVPAVIGPAGRLYLTDNHHHMAAVEYTQDSDIWALDVTVDLVCDLSSASTMDEFWSEMQQRNYVFLMAPGATPKDPYASISPTHLPVGWSQGSGGFVDDAWRAVVAFASHQTDADTRCYVDSCTPFQDFEWSYVGNAATFGSASSLWSSSSTLSDFKTKLSALPYPSVPSKVDLTTWEQLGETLSSGLCHQAGVDSFQLPSAFPAAHPEGFVAAGTVVPADPDCPHNACSADVVV